MNVGAVTSHSGDDFISAFGPGEGLGVLIVGVCEGMNGFLELACAAVNAPTDGSLGPAGQIFPRFVGRPVGDVGIPLTRIPGTARGFARLSLKGEVYLTRLPSSAVARVKTFGFLALESEYAEFTRIPRSAIVGTLPASRIPSLTVVLERNAIVHGVALP